MSFFDEAFDFAMRWEGGLTEDPADRGGITNYGVSIEYLRGLEATVKGRSLLKSLSVPLPVEPRSIRGMSRGVAKELFRYSFWTPISCEEFTREIGTVLFDLAMNAGCAQSVKCVQRGYNDVVRSAALADDGIVGPLTLSALKGCDSAAVARRSLDRRRDFYRAVVARRPSQKVFLKGWLNRTDALQRHLGL